MNVAQKTAQAHHCGISFKLFLRYSSIRIHVLQMITVLKPFGNTVGIIGHPFRSDEKIKLHVLMGQSRF